MAAPNCLNCQFAEVSGEQKLFLNSIVGSHTGLHMDPKMRLRRAWRRQWSDRLHSTNFYRLSERLRFQPGRIGRYGSAPYLSGGRLLGPRMVSRWYKALD